MAYKEAKCLCNVFLEKAKKQHFQKFPSNEKMTNKEFCDTVKPFFTVKSVRGNAPVSLEINNKRVIGEQKLLQEFNSYYGNIVQNISGRIPSKLGAINPSLIDSEIVKRIIENLSQKSLYRFANAPIRNVNKRIQI